MYLWLFHRQEEGAVSEPREISNDLDEQQERYQAAQLQGTAPENTTTQTQAEDLFWRWVSLKNFTVQELKELREDRLLSCVFDQRDLRIEFAHLIAKRQLHSVMEGLRQ
ncbi:Hypothetical protein PHPALM_5674, partial [Phytophthora palmivora]